MTTLKTLTTGYTVKFQLTCPWCNQHEFPVTPPIPPAVKRIQHTCEVCSTPWDIDMDGKEAALTVNQEEQPVYGYALLAYTGGGLPHYVVVKTMINLRHHHGDREEAVHHLNYFYKEHTCPTNFVGVECVVVNADYDPHGMYTFVRFVSNQEIKNKYHLTWEQFSQLEFSSDVDGTWVELWAEIFPESQRTGPVEPSTFR